MATYGPPTQDGFLAFVRGTMGISSKELPDSDPAITWSFDIAIDTVNCAIAEISAIQYQIAVFSLAGDTLINLAQDQKGHTFFADLRERWKVNDFVAGTVAASADETTSTTLTVPEAFKNLTLSDLQNLKTPYGRAYLSIAQKFGYLWGIT